VPARAARACPARRHRRGTVDFIPNYDGNEVQPVVLPARFPNLLVNGSQGIAVGMATNIPPHNLGEVIDANTAPPGTSGGDTGRTDALREGPDFRWSTHSRPAGLIDAYPNRTRLSEARAVAEITESRSGADQIIVTEIPYQTSVAGIEMKIADAIESGDLTGLISSCCRMTQPEGSHASSSH